MRILITLGATREPIDAVRFIGNRSSGKMGAALVSAAMGRGHSVTAIVGVISVTLPMSPAYRRIDVESARQMHDAVVREFPDHDLLIMAAAVADYRPIRIETGKLPRSGNLTIVCEPTEDILAAVASTRRTDQRVVGFSLEEPGNLDRARQKLIAKKLDLMVFNPLQTVDNPQIDATLIWPGGNAEPIGRRGKTEMSEILVARSEELFR
jgi:phosphopantothenoylcysteine decarboxylase / phosphopantothenate---cysteine ligase